MRSNPCKNCPVRKVGCHSWCPYYKEFKQRLNEISKKRRLANLFTGKASVFK